MTTQWLLNTILLKSDIMTVDWMRWKNKEFSCPQELISDPPKGKNICHFFTILDFYLLNFQNFACN